MKTSTAGRQDPGQKECTFMAHRDNFEILRKDYRKTLDFLQVNPDGTGYKFQGMVDSYQDEVSVGGNLTGKAVITVTKSDDLPVNNVVDIIEETVTFTSAIDAIVTVTVAEGDGHTAKVNVDTDPSDATVTATSDTASVATATIADGVLTITGVKAGSAIVKIEAKKTDCADGVTHILVIVK